METLDIAPISRKLAVPKGAAGILLSKLECQQLREI